MELNNSKTSRAAGKESSPPCLEFHITVRGASHIRKKIACQDSSKTIRFGASAAAAVADGHGDVRYFRSRFGSRFAVDAALKSIREFVTLENGQLSSSCVEEKMTQLKKNIILNWNRKVCAHLSRHPFLEEELAPLSDARRTCLIQGREIESAYGTTLIAAAMTPRFWFGVQIGDGDCIAAETDGTFEAVPRGPGLVANITTSLCEPDAIDKFLHLYKEERPGFVLMSTDGIRNSFDSRENYNRFMRKIALSFSSEPYDQTHRFLKSFLRKMTVKGSGDDLSVAGMIDTGENGYRGTNIAENTAVRGGPADIAG